MAATSKLSFRARHLDANKSMTIYYADDLPDLSECAPINRAVAQMPTGMEKDEEMESHLQDAILAQQASTSGIAVENHVIPTPKVESIDDARYDSIYPCQPPPPKNQLIKVQAWLSMDQEEPEYDMDSEDEAWLSQRPHISARDLEKIVETLEGQSSDNNICRPGTARSCLSSMDESVVDDVYDYWLTKRSAFTRLCLGGTGGLIPKVRTECRKDSAGAVNPYVAFRRRAEKMQTRKNRKNDEDSYEKVLKLGHDLRKTVTLFDMVKRREKTKLALMDLDADILTRRMALSDFGSTLYNQFVAKVRPEFTFSQKNHVNGQQPLKDDNGQVKKAKKRRKLRTGQIDREVPSKAWLKKNAEVWNQPPSVFTGVSPVVEVDKSVAASSDSNLDGRFTFKRRRGCVYRAPLPFRDDERPSTSQLPPERRFFKTTLVGMDGQPHPIGFARRRLGRGGRVIFDRMREVPRVPVMDPFDEEFLQDQSVEFRQRLLTPSPPPTQRHMFGGDSDEEREAAWLASARSPTPEADDPPPPHILSGDVTGNVLQGRVESKDPLPKNGTRSVDEAAWRSASGSPSESNSSGEWAAGGWPLTSTLRMLVSEEEAARGDVPAAAKPGSPRPMLIVSRCPPLVRGPL